MNETEKFLKEMKITGTRTEITAMFDGKIKTIKESEIETCKKNSNLYYLAGVDFELEFWKRARDYQIISKNSFTIDVDIRSQFDGELTNLEIVQEGLTFVELLKDHHPLFGQWSKIIFTGNGLHLVYKGKLNTFNSKQYKLGVKSIFKQWDDFIGSPELRSDHACCNLARILRLPGSINQKNGAKVKIIGEQDSESELFNNIKLYALISGYNEIIKTEAARKELMKKNYDEGNDTYEAIQAIPAYNIALLIVPEFPYDNKKNFKNKKGGLTGYYYVKETNSICNGGSSHYFTWGDSNSCFAPFQIIQKQYSLSNKETFEYFKEKFNI